MLEITVNIQNKDPSDIKVYEERKSKGPSRTNWATREMKTWWLQAGGYQGFGGATGCCMWKQGRCQ